MNRVSQKKEGKPNEWLRLRIVRDDGYPSDFGPAPERWLAMLGTEIHYVTGEVRLDPCVLIAQGPTEQAAKKAAEDVLSRMACGLKKSLKGKNP